MRFKISRWQMDELVNDYKRGWDKSLISMTVEGDPIEEKKEGFKCVHGHTEEEIIFYGCETNPKYHGATITTTDPSKITFSNIPTPLPKQKISYLEQGKGMSMEVALCQIADKLNEVIRRRCSHSPSPTHT